MTDKSHVSMEQHQCIVCGELYDTGNILLDKRLKKSMEQRTVTGTGLCPEHQKLKDDGFVALIEANEQTKERTGRIAHLRKEVWPKIFSVPFPGGMVAYSGKEVLDMLEREAS
jgi:tRNA(Glu) U13 pseudouridine synthase TruD